jgi:hypothetical protein
MFFGPLVTPPAPLFAATLEAGEHRCSPGRGNEICGAQPSRPSFICAGLFRIVRPSPPEVAIFGPSNIMCLPPDRDRAEPAVQCCFVIFFKGVASCWHAHLFLAVYLLFKKQYIDLRPHVRIRNLNYAGRC